MADKYRGLLGLEGRIVLVAGGTGAIGSEMARGLAAFGAKVAIGGRDARTTEGVAIELTASGATSTSVALDLLDPESLAKGVAAVEATLGPLAALVNAAGTHIEQPAEEYAADAWDAVVDVNLKGAFMLSQAAARAMIAHGQGGSIAHVTSVRSNLGIRRGYAAYVASKGGLGILIKQLASEWARFGIRVNGIAPTFTRTPLVDKYLNDPQFYSALV